MVLVLLVSTLARAQLRTTVPMNVSNVYDSPLPAFFFLEGSSEGSLPRAWGVAPNDVPWDAVVDDSCSDDVFASPQPTLRDHILPHTLQFWDAAEAPTDVEAIVLESAALKLVVAPRWGAKVHSLTDKATGAPLLLENPTHTPFNGAVRKPFASGGIEWNWGGGRGQIGHSVFTEEPAFVAKVEDGEGEHVRIYEYDRFNGTLWQVDLLLPNSTSAAASRAAWIHVKLTNPSDEDLRGYWWTNTARHTTFGGRVLSPARQAAESGVCPSGGMSCALFPHYTDECGQHSDVGRECLNRSKGRVYDHSMLGNLGSGRDAFLRVYKGDETLPAQGNFVAHADREVYGPHTVGSFHGVYGDSSVKDFGIAPNGTKYFAYPHDRVGQWWQDWLSGHTQDDSHLGNYLELQIGPAPSQMQTFSHPKHSVIEWTEYILPMTGANADKLHGASYSGALSEVQAFLDSKIGMPRAEIARIDAKLKKMAAEPLEPSAILAHGMPWGALEEKRAGKRLSSSAPFTYARWANESNARPWAELLEKPGEFSEQTLAQPTTSFMLDDGDGSGLWMKRVRSSKPTWLRSLLLGVASAERAGGMAQQAPDLAEARALFAESYRLKPNPLAARCLAVSAPTQAAAARNFSAAWALAKGVKGELDLQQALASEIAAFQLARTDDAPAAAAELDAFLASLEGGGAAARVRSADNVLLAKATRALAKQRCAGSGGVRAILRSSRFATFFSGTRTALADLWATCAALDYAKRKGYGGGLKQLSSVERHRVRMSEEAAPPGNIGPFAGKILIV